MQAIPSELFATCPSAGLGMVAYLIVEDRAEVQLLIVTWAG
jgi:hypothetical protein